MQVTREMLESSRNSNGVHSSRQNKLCKKEFGCLPIGIIGKEVADDFWSTFVRLERKKPRSESSIKKRELKKQKEAKILSDGRAKYKAAVEANNERVINNGSHINITSKMLKAAKNSDSKMQIIIAKEYGGMSRLVGQTVPTQWWNHFKEKGFTTSSIKTSKVAINPVSQNKGEWEWAPSKSDIPKLKTVSTKGNKNRGKSRQKRIKISRQNNDDFYMSREWRSLRVRVLEKYECKCMMCGRSPKLHNVVVHVDHIKPRSKHPELSLAFDNLQLLCEDCNLGKSNKYDTDWRP